jgi:hypothetical protein
MEICDKILSWKIRFGFYKEGIQTFEDYVQETAGNFSIIRDKVPYLTTPKKNNTAGMYSFGFPELF